MRVPTTRMIELPVLTLLVLSWLIACGRGTGETALTVAVSSGVEGDALKAAAQDYQAERGVSIEIAEFPYANLFEKELLDLVNQTGAYDLIMLDDPWFPRFAAGAHRLTELPPLYKKRGLAGPDEDFVKASLALCRRPYGQGALLALPYVGNSQLYFYRRDLFRKYDLPPPERWDDVLTAARVIKEKEGRFGYVMRAAQGNPVVADFMPLFWAFGGEMFDPEGRPTVDSPQGIAALNFMIELGQYSPPGYVSFNADEVAAHLLQGTAAQGINWPAWISAFHDPATSKVVGKIEITTMPGQQRPGQAEIGNWLLAIPRATRHPQAAFDFMLWATTPQQMRQSALRGNPPTRQSVFQDHELQTKFPSFPVQLKSLETSRPRPRTPLWNEIENAFGIYLSKANSGQLPPQRAMIEANEEIARIIKRGR